MGLGAQTIELYRQMKMLGLLEDVTNVMELGSQDFFCEQTNLMKALFAAFGRPCPAELLTATMQAQQSARRLYESLGIAYHCLDVDGRPGTMVMDFNFDSLPDKEKGRYCLVTNYGTSEHVLNQSNIFKSMHDLARTGGLMIHAVPFMGYIDHGFFSYHPNFFECLARYNSYEILGLWIGAGSDGRLASYVPWDQRVLEFLPLTSNTAHILTVAYRKMYDRQFCVPFQQHYEDKVPEDVLIRYSMVIDGDIFDGKRVKYLTKEGIAARNYENTISGLQSQITGLNNVVDSYIGQVDKLTHELAVTKNELEQNHQAKAVLSSQSAKKLINELKARVWRRVRHLGGL